MRAFRPSRFGAIEEPIVDPAEEIARLAKVETYAKRAEARRPLFEEDAQRHLEASGRED